MATAPVLAQPSGGPRAGAGAPPAAVPPAAAAATAELTVVVPCRNEAENVAAVVERLGRALAGVAWEVVFVDDDSPDGTAAVAKAMAARDPRVRCLRRVGRRGLSSACLEGMLASAAPFVAVMDGDLQHDERLLPRMLDALRRGEAEVVVGSRRVAGGGDAEGLSPLRRAVSEAGGAMARALLPVPLADPMSGFFAQTRHALRAEADRPIARRLPAMPAARPISAARRRLAAHALQHTRRRERPHRHTTPPATCFDVGTSRMLVECPGSMPERHGGTACIFRARRAQRDGTRPDGSGHGFRLSCPMYSRGHAGCSSSCSGA